MSKVAIVILNYLNYEDTIECVESILSMQYSICGIVIVDNGSNNNSYQILKAKYNKKNKIKVISSGANLGYAKGNNIGIAYARKYLHADFVLVANNDTIFIDKFYIEGLLKEYQPGVGVLGGRHLLKGNIVEARRISYRGFKTSIPGYINRLSRQHGSCFDFTVAKGEPIMILQGCSLLFTPDFFKKYRGFYKRTFLYNEEVILYYMCMCKNMRQVYVPDVCIFHKQDMSSLMSFQNDPQIFNKYSLQSEKYAIWWELRYYVYKLLRLC